MAVKFKHFTVRGNGPFPVDMLRYDGCWPSDQESVLDMVTKKYENAPWEVRLTTIKDRPSPTTGRWASFGWRVVKEEK